MCRTIFIFIFAVQAATAGSREFGARAKGIGSAFTAISDDLSAPAFNVAGLASLPRPEILCFISPREFGVPGLAFASAGAGVPTRIGTVACTASRYGNDLYHELAVDISYARIISGLSVGCTIRSTALTIARYGSVGSIGVDIGVLASPVKSLRWALVAADLNAPAIGRTGEKIPGTVTAAVAWIPAQGLVVDADLQKEGNEDPSVRLGFEYTVGGVLALRAGFSGVPELFSGGIGLRAGSITLDYAVTVHDVLGPTQQASVSISWGGSDD